MQRPLVSLIEQVSNVGSGFIISLTFWTYFIVPVFGMNLQMTQNLQITGLFTVISVLRGFIFRRAFNLLTTRTHTP